MRTQTHTHVWTCKHTQILTGQICAAFKKGDLQFPLSPLCVFFYPSSLHPHSSPYSLCAMKTPQEKQYHRIFEALDCCRTAVHTNLSGSVTAFEGETYSNTTPLLLKHIQKCSTLVFMSWDVQTDCLPPAFAPADIWHARKCKDAWGQKQAKTHENTHLLRLIVMKALRKEMKESQRADYGNPGLYSMEGVVEMIKAVHILLRHNTSRTSMNPLWMSEAEGAHSHSQRIKYCGLVSGPTHLRLML